LAVRAALTGALLGGLLTAPAAAAADHAVILAYHHVAEDTPASTSVDPATFEDHLAHLADNGYRVRSLPKVLERLQAGQPVPDKTVVLTFDDAYRSVYTQVWPRLRERGWPFSVFVSTRYIDQGLPHYMDWDQLRELQGAEGVTLGNHTHSHPHLVRRRSGEGRQEWAARVREEIRTAQQRLESKAGGAARILAYPYGEYSPALKKLVSELGYRALGQHSGPVGTGTDALAVPRFPMAAGFARMESFRTKVATRPLPVVSSEPAEGAQVTAGRPPPKLVLNLGEGDFRPGEIACYSGGQGRIESRWRQADRQLVVSAREPLQPGRAKYNCTAPYRGSEGGGYYWHSFLWLVKRPDGSWWAE
jgi:peptidoglycan/xylan/chitin deacetylase (PgdA/CDA1 family)